MNHEITFDKIFSSLDPIKFTITAREGTTIEFKESFNWNSRSQYLKSMAAFANNRGGYLIFGVSNSPRIVVGLKSDNFENIDEATITAYFNGCKSPELHYEKFIIEIAGRKVGILFTHEAPIKPVMAIKNDGDIRESDIYYRYNARNDRIKYPELKGFFDFIREEERKGWMRLFEKVSQIGPENTGILDIVKGSVEGKNGSLLIDHKLIPKLKFIKDGHFSENGKVALKLVGDVFPINVSGSKKGSMATFRLTDDPSAMAVKEETILKDFPWDYAELLKNLTTRYSDFKANNDFYLAKKKIVADGKYLKSRYLDPNNPKGMKKDFYNPKILTEFDKIYTRAKK